MSRITSILLTLTITTAICMGAFWDEKPEGRWTERAPLPTGRSDSGVSVSGVNSIVVTGGCDGPQLCGGADFCSCSSVTNKTEIFKPEDNQWVSAAPMPRSRFRHGQETLNGLVYVFGGRGVDDNLIPEVDVYDPVKNQWSTLPEIQNFNNTLSDFATVVVDSIIFVIGGYNAAYENQGSTIHFNPAVTNNNTWIVSNATLKFPRGDVCAAVKGDNIYLVGGFDDSFCVPLTEWEIYSIKDKKWYSGTAPQPTKGGDKACSLLHGSYLTFGGELKDKECSKYSVPSNETFEYYQPTDDIYGGQWRELVAVPSPRFRFSSVYYQHQTTGYEAIYTIGGQESPDKVKEAYAVSTVVYAYSDYTLPHSPYKLPAGAIAGIVIGGAVFIALVVIVVLVAVYFLKKNKSDKKDRMRMEDL